MSTLRSGVPSPASAAAVEDSSSHWVPHGTMLTACVVGVNALVIVLIFFLFWRFLFGKEEPPTSSTAADEEDEDDSPPVASPWASRWRRHEADLGAPPLEDVASALPVYIYSGAGAGADEGGGKQQADECAVCIVELRDGEPARRVPRCGHQFHADCVATWLRLHATCPLCRASVAAAAAPAAAGAAVAEESRNAKAEDDDDVAADCPV
ncbi:unnamed protein product [Urochloa humidicola]